MRLLFENWREFISEEIIPYENKAIVYHAFGRGSTGDVSVQVEKEKILDRIQTLREKGFIPGEGDFYGRGIYTVRNSSDLRREYGDFVFKFEVENLNKYAIFDYKEAKKVYGKNHTLKEQLEQNGFIINEELQAICDRTDYFNKQMYAFTSKQALPFSRYLRSNPSEREKINGIVFTGGNDGSVLVGYEISDFTLVGFGETLSVKSTSFYKFLKDQAKFIEQMKSFYKIQNEEIEPDNFFRDILNAFYTEVRTVENYMNNKGKIKNQIISKITNYPTFILKEDYVNQKMEEALGPEVFEYYQKLHSPEDFDYIDEYDDIIYDTEKELEKEFAQIVKSEITRFVEKYLDFVFRKFKLSDEAIEVNIIDLERPFNMSGGQNV
jgi:hypothetical protein